MKVSFRASHAKVAFLAVLGVSTYWVSSTFLVMPGKHGAIAAAPATAVPLDTPSISDTPSTHSGTLPLNGDSSGLAASFSVEEREFNQHDGFAYVFAKFNIRDKRPNSRYTWSLVAKERSSKEIVFKRVYADQVFSSANEQSWSPTFTDAIKLPPGDYSVRLTLHGLPKGMGPEALEDEEFAANQILLSVHDYISIQ